MRVRLLVVLLFFIAHPFLCVSQTNQVRSNSRSLKLEQCIDLALANNLDVRIQRLSTDATTFSLTSAYGAYDPTFSIFARRDYLEQPPDVDFKKATPDNPYNLQTDSAGGTFSGIAPIGLN